MKHEPQRGPVNSHGSHWGNLSARSLVCLYLEYGGSGFFFFFSFSEKYLLISDSVYFIGIEQEDVDCNMKT